MNMDKDIKVSAVVVVYGSRWNLLRQVLDATLKDKRITNLIIVDNASINQEEMLEYSKTYPDIIYIIRNEKNIGYSPAINKGLNYIRNTDCDYVFVLDDDCVPEDNYLDYFIQNLELFPNKKVILSANRENVPGYREIFFDKIDRNNNVKGTIFEILTFKNIFNFIKNYLYTKNKKKECFLPIIPTSSFVTGGSFLPIEAVKEAPLPDPSLFMYGEDLQYSWGIKKLGYDSYLCYRPKIKDIDMTFDVNMKNSHIFGLFDKKTPDYKVYLRLRNSIRISIKNTYQNKLVLFINIIFWFLGLLILNLLKYGLNKFFIYRSKIVLQALKDGYSNNPIPNNIKTP